MCKWDPIGVTTDPDWPRDEYDCLLSPLLRMLEAQAADASIADYLQKELNDHFGLTVERKSCLEVARKLRSWFDRAWSTTADLITIYVALLDEGVDVWRPVQARPLADGLYRIVGIEPDPGDEKWQFRSGAIVRCEDKRFSDSQAGLVAVEQREEAV